MYIKNYEELMIDQPQVGDYIKISINNFYLDKIWENYVNNSIGQIIKIKSLDPLEYKVNITLSDDIIQKAFNDKEKKLIKIKKGKKYIKICLMRSNIVYFANTIEELKIKINLKKYNL